MAIFDASSNICIKRFTAQSRAMTVYRQSTERVYFIRNFALSGDNAGIVHYLREPGDQRMVVPAEHLFKGKIGTV